jgi:hypothetical protein
VTLGPYRLSVATLGRELMRDRRSHVCVNIEHGRIEFRDDLRGMRLAEAFFQCIVRLAHFSNGCQQGCVEEAYTHSFASGLVEFVHRNPDAWIWFNTLLSEHLAGDVHYDRVVRGIVSRPPQMPRRVLIAGQAVSVRAIGKTECGNAFGWYDPQKCEAQLFDGLVGSNLAVVALHELTHAVHHRHALKQRDKHKAFREAQVKGWMSIITRSPAAWRWLAWVMTFPGRARLAPLSRRTLE